MDTNNNPMPNTPSPSHDSSGDDKKLMGILSYLGILVLIPLLTDAKKDSFVKFHVKQGLVLLITEVAASFIIRILFFAWMLAPLVGLATFVLLVMGIMNVVNGRTKELPVIGHFANKFTF